MRNFSSRCPRAVVTRASRDERRTRPSVVHTRRSEQYFTSHANATRLLNALSHDTMFAVICRSRSMDARRAIRNASTLAHSSWFRIPEQDMVSAGHAKRLMLANANVHVRAVHSR